MRTLHVIALGGTIASSSPAGGVGSGGGPTGTPSGVAPSITAAEITAAARLDSLPGDPVEVTVEQLAQVGSGSITLDILHRVVRSARAAARRGATGIVLTQGTDTLEDSAFALALLNDAGIPIVLTGAMRNPTLPGADGPANVRAAAVVALAPEAAGLRAALIFADEVHDPVFVRKAHASHVSPFTSGPVIGALGWVAEDRLHLPHVPVPRSLPAGLAVPEHAEPVAPEPEDAEEVTEGHRSAPPNADGDPHDSGAGDGFPRVAQIEVGFDDGLEHLAALPDLGYAGAVIAGVGGGHVAEWAVERVAALAARLPVVLASRTGAGATLESTYGYPGAEIDLLGRGLIPAGCLDPRTARIALTLALARGIDPAEVFAAFR